MYPDNGVSPVKDLGIFQNCKAVIDMIYNPLRTKLLMQAEERSIKGTGGLLMLVAQAKKAAEMFTQSSIPDAIIEEITNKIANMTGNIILIGMPGCGKSSIGKALAENMKREFADTDELIAEEAGKSVPAIIEEDGENAFRKLESEALNSVCKQSGLVIATGGGIVKQAGNRDLIRQNGTVIFLDRDLNELPTAGRPLSESEGIASLAKTRLPLYKEWSDLTVAVHGVGVTAANILKSISEGV